jgi:hypothetical protein
MPTKEHILSKLPTSVRGFFETNPGLAKLLKEAIRAKDFRYSDHDKSGDGVICYYNNNGIQVITIYKDGRYLYTRNCGQTCAGRKYTFSRMYSPENQIVWKTVRVYPKYGDVVPVGQVTGKSSEQGKILLESDWFLAKWVPLEKSFTTP